MYDLVVIGHTPEAFYAATLATHLGARVALALTSETPMGCWTSTALTIAQTQSPQLLCSLMEELRKNHSEVLVTLAGKGVDIIKGNAEFCRLPQPAVVVNQRHLKARRYLLATGQVPMKLSTIEGIDSINCLSLWEAVNKIAFLPDNLLLIGETPEGISLAQILVNLGKKVTLALPTPQLLPQEDPELSLVLQTYLEIQGVKVLTKSSVTQLKYLDGQKWAQVGNKAIAADEIILSQPLQLQIMGLNLESQRVQEDSQGLVINHKLQTTNPNIYACTSPYEAHIAVYNALCFPIHKLHQYHQPRVIPTNPPLASVGLSVRAAHERYGDKVIVIKEFFNSLTIAQISPDPTGFCQVITHPSGHILGAAIVGHLASELIAIFALAIKNKLKINQLGFNHYSLTYSEIVHLIVLQWERQRFHKAKGMSRLIKLLNTKIF